jgi:TrmH family RNA methyltransferase
MITSKDNEKLKLVRRLHERRHREREDLFTSEGEDLLEAGIAAGLEPEVLLTEAGAALGGDEVEPRLLAGASTLGSGTRAIAVWRRRGAAPDGPVCVYLDRVADPGNVGAIVRSADALVAGTVVLGAESADPYSPKAVRASMGSVFARPPAIAPVGETPAPRIALVAHGGEPIEDGIAAGVDFDAGLTVCLGAERSGLPAEVLEACERRWTIPLRPRGAESLNVAAAAAIALQRISSAAAEGT